MPGGLRSIRSYALYYGMGGEAELSRYDLAIVDPGGRTASGVRHLKGRGTRAVAYLSVLEVPRRPGAPPPENVLTCKGQPLANEEYNNWILDPRSNWTKMRLLDLADRVIRTGYDGFFLDCISHVESRELPPELTSELVPAGAWLVAELAREFPGALLVQNWGLHDLLPLTAQMLDGVCFEDFPYREIAEIPNLHSGVRRLKGLHERLGLRVLALNHGMEDPKERAAAIEAAEMCGFLWYGTGAYTDLPLGANRHV